MDLKAILVLLCLALSFTEHAAPQEQNEVKASILEICIEPLKYDSKVVRITAWVRLNPHDASLESDDFERDIPIVRAGFEGVRLPSQLRETKDQLYTEFWEYLDDPLSVTDGPHGMRVELDGYIRLLKKNGKLTDEYHLYGQKPIEIIPLKIRKIEIYP